MRPITSITWTGRTPMSSPQDKLSGVKVNAKRGPFGSQYYERRTRALKAWQAKGSDGRIRGTAEERAFKAGYDAGSLAGYERGLGEAEEG